MPDRLNQFALGTVYHTGDGVTKSAATTTGNDLNSNVKSAVSDEDWAREYYDKRMSDD